MNPDQSPPVQPAPDTQAAERASRRSVLKAVGAAAAIAGGAGTAAVASAPAPSDVITRVLPRSPTGERVPVIGLGSFMTFDRAAGDRTYIARVIRELHQGGGRVLDTSALYGSAETNVGQSLAELGLTDDIFLTNKSWNCGDYLNDPSHAIRQFEQSQERLGRSVMDVVGVHSMTNTPMILPILRSLKARGQVRYVGVTSHEGYQYAGMEPLIGAGLVDVVQVRYSMFYRLAEDRLLELAADNGVAVMVNMALEKGRLHHLVRGRELPRHARELEVESWAEYFLKYVIAHPAVTCVVPATTSPEHARENVRAMRGPLPDHAMRRHMLRHMERIPGFDQIATMPWYPGRTFEGALVRLPEPRPTI